MVTQHRDRTTRDGFGGERGAVPALAGQRRIEVARTDETRVLTDTRHDFLPGPEEHCRPAEAAQHLAQRCGRTGRAVDAHALSAPLPRGVRG